MKNTGNLIAAVNPQFFSMRGYTCGSGLRVMCTKKPYCKHSNFVDVKIVDECDPSVCHGENDLVLSKEAFDDVANTNQPTIEVQWTFELFH